ncbi:MADS-box transcription factor PHERES like [Actinidia chinensis var. chinensis]|uniref:MADS-box transcription factor PHERES like n=1 Tax=Actinidia chinensis var. chinensis TaxID=1590841 RepID=A0A2R6QFR1_ACTCC|nr:MADS-box transcription factor PHERES like [Actinidia chinensis var. chinensis]
MAVPLERLKTLNPLLRDVLRPSSPVKWSGMAETGRRNRPMKMMENKRARMVTYTKRKDCIKKKTMELSTLCGIQACTVCFGPDGAVETWPENPNDVKAVIDLYRVCVKNGRGGGGIGGNLGERVKKVEEESGGAKKDELKKGLLGWNDDWLSGLSAEQLMVFLGKLEVKIESVMDKIGFLNMTDRAPNYGFEMMNSGIAKNNVELASSIVCQNPLRISDYSHNSMISFEIPMNLETPNYCFEMKNSEMASYRIPLPIGDYSNNSMVNLGFPMKSTPPIWALDYYINPMVSFDDPVNSTKPVWPVNCFGDPISSNEKLKIESALVLRFQILDHRCSMNFSWHLHLYHHFCFEAVTESMSTEFMLIMEDLV